MNQRLPAPYEETDNHHQLAESQARRFAPAFDPAALDAPDESDGLNPRNIAMAIIRHKWVILGCLILGAAASVMVHRDVELVYQAEGSLWVQRESDAGGLSRGPISSAGLVDSYAWVDLLRSFEVLDTVAMSEGLYLDYPDTELSDFFSGFAVADEYLAGNYALSIAEDGSSFTLRGFGGIEVDSGPAGDSIGPNLGFHWQPESEYYPLGQEVAFSVRTPRDAARRLQEELFTQMDQTRTFIRVQLTGKEPERLARVINALMERHVRIAARFKRARMDETTRILENQLAQTYAELQAAEANLEEFRVQTITLPTSTTAPIVGGLTLTRDPVFNQFFELRTSQEDLRQDRQRLQAFMDAIPERGLEIEALESIGAVSESSQIEGALEELTEARTQVRTMRLRYTDEHPPLQAQLERVQVLEGTTVPTLVQGLITELDAQGRDVENQLRRASAELQNIPPRAIEEARLERRVEIADNLYTELRSRYEQSRLAAASTIPDVRILDRASVPRVPQSDNRIRLIMIVMAAALGLGIAVAVTWDRMDPMIRDPDQVRSQIGTSILGTIPRLVSHGKNQGQVREAFRDVRLNLAYAYGSAGALAVTITSPAANEGKTFISTNLAIAFAEFGRRVILIDGDTRRGDAHEPLELNRRPGLVDHLEGHVDLSGAIQTTPYDGLDLLSSGSRTAGSPELLGSTQMRELLAELRTRYDVIIVDSPPLGAGSDALVLATLTGSLALVLRNGISNKDFAIDRLAPLNRLPVRLLGAVVNDVVARASFRRYNNYIAGYEPMSEALPPAAVGSLTGS